MGFVQRSTRPTVPCPLEPHQRTQSAAPTPSDSGVQLGLMEAAYSPHIGATSNGVSRHVAPSLDP